MAENIAIDHLRRGQRGHERFMPQRADGEAPLREPLTPDIAERLGHRQALDAVAAALATLPARSRDIFLADRLDGASHAELAARHGVSVKTVEREVMHAMDGVEAVLHRWRGEAVPPARTGRRRAGARYIGRRANDEYNSSFERGVTLVDAALHYEQGPWRLALNVSNLFDKDYKAICYHGECYRGNLRSATVTARYRF